MGTTPNLNLTINTPTDASAVLFDDWWYDQNGDSNSNATKLDAWAGLVSGSITNMSGSLVTNGNSHDHIGGDGAAITEAALTLTAVTTNDATISRHGFLPMLDSDPSSFLNGGGTWSNISEGVLSLSNVTTANADTSRHGFLPKLPNSSASFIDGTGTWDTIKDSDLVTSDVTTNNATTAKHGFLSKLPNLDHQFLDGTGAWVNIQAGDGWHKDTDTWSYVSATSFQITGKDVSLRFLKGTKIFLVQTTSKYFYVVDATYTGGNTVVTITGGSSYSLANATITAAYYSYAENPQAFPHWFNWTPSFIGYSSNPTNAVYRFSITSSKVFFAIREAGNGTSNSAAINISIPVVAATVTNHLWMFPAAYVDNGTASTTWGRAVISSSASMIVLGANPAVQDGFTASGNKRVTAVDGWYEF